MKPNFMQTYVCNCGRINPNHVKLKVGAKPVENRFVIFETKMIRPLFDRSKTVSLKKLELARKPPKNQLHHHQLTFQIIQYDG